jgi:hypothetical protein
VQVTCAAASRGLSGPAPKVQRAEEMATGGIVIAAIMLLVFPVLIMFGGAIWSALMGWLLVEDADQRATTPDASPSSE